MYPPMISGTGTLTGMQIGAMVFDTSDGKLKLYKNGSGGLAWYAIKDTTFD